MDVTRLAVEEMKIPLFQEFKNSINKEVFSQIMKIGAKDKLPHDIGTLLLLPENLIKNDVQWYIYLLRSKQPIIS